MKLLFATELVVLLVLFAITRKRIQTYQPSQENRLYSLSAILPFTMSVLELLDYRYNSKYDKKISKLLLALYGGKHAVMHLKLYYSSKAAAILVAILLLSLFGAASDTVDMSYMILLLLAPIGLFFLLDKELEGKLKKKYSSIRADFPDMVSKLVLLVNAGMTLSRAWERICLDTKKMTPLYQELKTTYIQIQGGKPESEAYEEFARRCRVKEITKFTALIIQNLKKGSEDMVPLLRLQAEECWELRKSRAKQLGEEASAKLLLPMMIMFVGILIIVLLPAVLQLSSL